MYNYISIYNYNRTITNNCKDSTVQKTYEFIDYWMMIKRTIYKSFYPDKTHKNRYLFVINLI